ncbi:MgtC/SapB family protein [Marinilactibacillus psychrotolerans]|uniref:Magnesium transporter MgtC n=1 Tax=Marinilactibacillus psychrotolerans TaxID=191770 RepID=A0AAV3WRU2_9LACT|nr:MgtC/SapB family protein [Marinilactibacillus psychrotolerans]GEL68152.1 magnesium transporter MgtC [Marinilactibacillus psychrotolerans]GEQ36694.1 magnesium transporter MgtC [Marinilactibacillus psychrotolerans]SDD38966.1 putative Mg2+ transporter-C (MgtC) family protein [Marinilactibacillus psychrotolerans]
MVETYWEMLIRLVIAAFVGGIIGYERELKGRDAGIRTHTLVSLGAAVITLTQLEASEWVINFARENADLPPVLTTDITRLTAQIINGIGFLGAGSIIVSKRSVTGLTTAASIWAVASLGIAVGMGYYFISLSGTLIMLLVLRVIKNLFRFDRSKQFEVKYKNRNETIQYLESCFQKYHVTIVSTDHSISYLEDGTSICQDSYSLNLPEQFNMMDFIADIGEYYTILEIKTIKTSLDNWN